MILPFLLGALIGAGASHLYTTKKGLDEKSPILVRIADPNLLTLALAQGQPMVKGAIDQAIVHGLQAVTIELRPWSEAKLRARLVYADSATATAAATAAQNQIKAMLPALAAGVGPAVDALKATLSGIKIASSGPTLTLEAPVPPAYIAMLHAAATPKPTAQAGMHYLQRPGQALSHSGEWSAIEDHMGAINSHYLNRAVGSHSGEWSAIEDHMGGLAHAACAQTGMLQ